MAGAFQSLFLPMAMWLVLAIAVVVLGSYFLSPRVRAQFPGGARRYLIALLVQATGFMAPIPIVLVMLLGAPLPRGADVAIAVGVGFGVLLLLRASPLTGPLLKDLRRARIEATIGRLGPRP